MNSQPRYQVLPVTAALLVLGVLLARQWQDTGGLAGVPLDDAYIHYRFADNLAHGRGFAFNPGEPTPGSTSPLWVVLLAAGELVGLDPIFTSKILGALAFVACAWLTWRIALRLMNKEPQRKDAASAGKDEKTEPGWHLASVVIPVVAGVLVALSGRVAWAALSGMETVAFTALTLLAVYRLLDHPLDAPASAILGLAALLRPEGHLLFALLAISHQWALVSSQRSTGIRLSLRKAILGPLSNILAFALIVSPYIIFSIGVTGSPLPNTFYANARELAASEYLTRYVIYMAGDNTVVLALAVLGAVYAWAGSRALHGWPVVLWAVCFPFVAAVLTPNLRHHGRYAIPLIPFNVLLSVIALREYLNRARSQTRPIVSGFCVAAVLVGLIGTWTWSGAYADDARDITQMHAAMGRWVTANTPPGATLALSDIGAITFFSGRRVLDIVGLVTPDILPSVAGKPVGLERDQAVFDYLARHRPDYVIIIPTWYPYLASSPGSHLIELHTIRLDHTPSVGGGDHLRAYSTDWSWMDGRAPEYPLTATLGGAIALDGFDLTPGSQIEAGSPLTLTLYWRSVQPTGRFKVFVHLADATGKPAAQDDSEPVGNLWPTNLWRAGDVIRDEHIIALPADISSGTYVIRIGMYDAKTGTRLPVASGGDAVTLGTVEVTQ